MTVCTMNARCNACERSILACVPDRTCAGRADCAMNEWNRALDARDELLREALRHVGFTGHDLQAQAPDLAERIRAALGKEDEPPKKTTVDPVK